LPLKAEFPAGASAKRAAIPAPNRSVLPKTMVQGEGGQGLSSAVGHRQKQEFPYPFRVLEKWREGLSLGPGARPERAGSIGWVAPYLRDQSSFPPKEAGGIFPAPSTEKSAPYDSNPAFGGTPGPWNPLALETHLSSKN